MAFRILGHKDRPRAGADPNAQDKFGESRLHAAAEGGIVGVVLHLLAVGFHMSSQSKVGITPPQRAALFGKPAVGKLLLVFRAGESDGALPSDFAHPGEC